MPRSESPWAGAIRSIAVRLRRFGQRRHDGTVAAALRSARATMKRKTYCVFTTITAEGPAARVLQPFPPRADFDVWFGTSASSRKVAELRTNGAATLVYQDDGRAACVVLVGRARVVDAIEQRRKRFMPAWWAFFPRGPEGDDYVLLHFEPHRIEVWDAWRGVTPEPFGLRSMQLVREAGEWRLA